MTGRRIDLSGTQVVASMLAAVTGAIAASYLGIAGTVIGAAVMSVASTAVAAVYKHYLWRGRERLRSAASAARGERAISEDRGHAAAYQRTLRPDAQHSGHAAEYQGTVTPETEQTEILPAAELWRQRQGAMLAARMGVPTRSTRPEPLLDRDRRLTRDVPGTPTRPARAGARRHGDDRRSRGKYHRAALLAGSAIGLFLLVMTGITAFEAATGKPIDALIWGRQGTGTTVGSLVSGQHHEGARPASGHASPHPTTAHATRQATATPAASSSPSPISSQIARPTASPRPTPSPSADPAASPSADPSPVSSPDSRASPAAAASGASAP